MTSAERENLEHDITAAVKKKVYAAKEAAHTALPKNKFKSSRI